MNRPVVSLDAATFQRIADLVSQRLGIVLEESKHHLVENRLRQQVHELGLDGFPAYLARVEAEPTGKLLSDLLDRITTNHTYFMRESAHFDHYRDHVLPEWTERLHGQNSRDWRVWCAACSMGQEPYTLAMLQGDFFKAKPGWRAGVLATDVSSRALDHARAGCYAAEEAKPLPERWRRHYGQEQGEAWQVGQALRNDITFRRLNLMREQLPFRKPFHVIFCRNVMIYFSMATRSQLVQRFHSVLETGGYLYLSHSESMPRDVTGFEMAGPSIYRRVD